jgi:hypothetical protein
MLSLKSNQTKWTPNEKKLLDWVVIKYLALYQISAKNLVFVFSNF